MREITPDPFKVYTLDELDEGARQRALENVAGKLAGDWWDSDNDDDVRDTMMYALADALGTPNVEENGGGVPNVKVTGWDLDRGQSLALYGCLEPSNAPSLPWVDEIEAVYLNGTDIGVQVADDACDGTDTMPLYARVMHETVRDAIHKAWTAGRTQMEYIGSEENAREHIEANEREFHADGSLYP